MDFLIPLIIFFIFAYNIYRAVKKAQAGQGATKAKPVQQAIQQAMAARLTALQAQGKLKPGQAQQLQALMKQLGGSASPSPIVRPAPAIAAEERVETLRGYEAAAETHDTYERTGGLEAAEETHESYESLQGLGGLDSLEGQARDHSLLDALHHELPPATAPGKQAARTAPGRAMRAALREPKTLRQALVLGMVLERREEYKL